MLVYLFQLNADVLSQLSYGDLGSRFYSEVSRRHHLELLNWNVPFFQKLFE